MIIPLQFYYLIMAFINIFYYKYIINTKYIKYFLNGLIALVITGGIYESAKSIYLYGFYARINDVWNSSHAVSYLFAFALMLLVAVFEKSAWKGYIYGGSIIAIHELLWYFFYPFFYPITWQNVIYYLPFQIFLISLLLVATYYENYSFIYVWLIALSVYTIWICLGFPITLDYVGKTVYYANRTINNIEIGSWIIFVFTGIYNYVVINKFDKEELI